MFFRAILVALCVVSASAQTETSATRFLRRSGAARAAKSIDCSAVA